MISLRKTFVFFFFDLSQRSINIQRRFCIKMPFLHRLACFRYVILSDVWWLIKDEGWQRRSCISHLPLSGRLIFAVYHKILNWINSDGYIVLTRNGWTSMGRFLVRTWMLLKVSRRARRINRRELCQIMREILSGEYICYFNSNSVCRDIIYSPPF